MVEIRRAAQKPANPWWRIFYGVSSYIVWIANRLGATPNQITITACILNTVTCFGLLFLPISNATIAAAYVGFFLAHSLDFADGQLAKALDLRSPQGAWLDSSLDIIKIAAVTAAFIKLINSSGETINTLSFSVFLLLGNIVNYSASLAAFAYRVRADPYENGPSQLETSLAIYRISGSAAKFLLANVREYGNFLFIMLFFLANASIGVIALSAWGALQWILAVNRIRYVFRQIR